MRDHANSGWSKLTKVVVSAALGGLLLGHAWAGVAAAAEVRVSPGGTHLRDAVAAAAPGDVLHLMPGEHAGGFAIGKTVSILGNPHVRVLGAGTGHVLVLDAPGIVVRGLHITGSGLKLETEDSGLFLTKRAKGARVEDNRLVDNLIGVYVKGAQDALIKDNSIVGRQDLRVNERGNGVQIWNAPGTAVEGNSFRHGRDGIFVTTSKRNSFRGNSFRDLRFAIHYMYTNQSEVLDNRSYGNDVGYALMYSRGLRVIGNLSEGDRDHGLLLNYTNTARIADNIVRGSRGNGADRAGPEKCVFIYNANKNDVTGNRFEDCGIGVHFTAGAERNRIAGNAFIGNRTQVKYVGTREIEWSRDGRGNFWSDNAAFDLNADGVADAPYRPNDLVDQIVWRHPLAKLLLNSPATQVLRWAQSAFPALYPGGVSDNHPLMAAPATGDG